MSALCHDCGTTPVWWFGDTGMCRRCALKGGSRYLAEQKIDPDKLRDWILAIKLVDSRTEAETMTIQILEECGS